MNKIYLVSILLLASLSSSSVTFINNSTENVRFYYSFGEMEDLQGPIMLKLSEKMSRLFLDGKTNKIGTADLKSQMMEAEKFFSKAEKPGAGKLLVFAQKAAAKPGEKEFKMLCGLLVSEATLRSSPDVAKVIDTTKEVVVAKSGDTCHVTVK